MSKIKEKMKNDAKWGDLAHVFSLRSGHTIDSQVVTSQVVSNISYLMFGWPGSL